MVNITLQPSKKSILCFITIVMFLAIGFQFFDAQVYLVSGYANSGNWELNEDMSDEFNGAVLDEAKWFIQGRNGEYQSNFRGCFPSQFSTNNVRLEGGRLKLETRWEPSYPFSPVNHPNTGESFENITTTAVIINKKLFSYGYMGVKSKSTNAEVTSAFWATGFQSEFDMFEMFGDPKDVSQAWRKRLKFNMIS